MILHIKKKKWQKNIVCTKLLASTSKKTQTDEITNIKFKKFIFVCLKNWRNFAKKDKKKMIVFKISDGTKGEKKNVTQLQTN